MAKPKPGPYPLVVVHWEDATNVAEWADIDEAIAFHFSFDYHCMNVGYLIRDDDECVVVAARVTGDFKAVGLCERIPRGMVQAVTVLVPAAS
jgi:hypothetical protein